MTHIRLLAAGAGLIIAGVLLTLFGVRGPGAWVAVGLEVLGMIVLGINVYLMLRTRERGAPPK